MYKRQALADRKKEVHDDDLIALMQDSMANTDTDYLQVRKLRVVCGGGEPAMATLTMVVGDAERTETRQGDGPVDAAFNAVDAMFAHQATLQLYQVHAVTEGTDAQATVSVRLEEDGRIATGQSADTDTILASVKAYTGALNRLKVRREKTAPDSDAKQVSMYSH